MTISDAAAARLAKLIAKMNPRPSGFRFEGYIGTCRGSSPILKPVNKPARGDQTFVVNNIQFFVPADKQLVFDAAALDVDRSFMGRGLYLTWGHMKGCDCECH